MADFGQLQQGWSDQLLAELGQGKFVLKHTEPGTVDPSAPWIPVVPVVTTEDLLGSARGVSSQLVGTAVGDTVIVATDIAAITSVPKGGYAAGDVMSLDGKDLMVIAVQRIPEGGVPAKVRFILR